MGTLIAVVDDEESVRKALQRLIRSAGFDVETFRSGAEFLTSMQHHEPACLVLEIPAAGPVPHDHEARFREPAGQKRQSLQQVVDSLHRVEPGDGHHQ